MRSDYSNHEFQEIKNDEFSSGIKYENIIETYSAATLPNTKSIIIKDEPNAIVFRYIEKTEVDRIFNARMDKVMEFVRQANAALEKVQIDDALRYYYWALSLVKSLKYPNEALIDIDGAKSLLIAWLPQKIESILRDVSFDALRRTGQGNTYDLFARYQNIPIRSLDYTFFDGLSNSSIHSISDGHGIMDLRSSYNPEYANIKIEYEFFGMARSDSDVELVLKVQQKALFPDASKHVELLSLSEEEKKVIIAENSVELSNELLVDNGKQYMEEVLDISRSLQSSEILCKKEKFTPEAWEEFSKILSYGSIMLNEHQTLECFEVGNETVCRGLSCNFKFGPSRVFNESLSFTFNREGIISHVALGIGRITMNDILEKAQWGEDSRKKLISFLEDYRTAYALKDIGYLEKVFDDDAIIIVGHVLKKDEQLTDKPYIDNKFITQTRYTKQEFMKRLRVSFASKEYINLHFTNLDIFKLRPDEEKYGIQLLQNYYSSNYGDTGYLCLLVDLTDIERPVIHVRTWQNAPDPEFGIITPYHF